MRLPRIPSILPGIASMAASAALLTLAATPPSQDRACFSSTALLQATYATHFGRQREETASSAQWRVRLREWRPSAWPPEQFAFALEDAKGNAVSQFTLHAWEPPADALQLNQIDELDIYGDRLLVLGRATASSSEADVIELPSGKILDRFPCFMPAVSPDHRIVAFLKSFPGHPGPVSINPEYLVYSLAQGNAYNRPRLRPGVTYDAGWPVYPPGATNAPGSNIVPGLGSPVHWISSGRLFWLDAKTLAFTDHHPGEDRLVVVDLSGGVLAPVVRSQALSPAHLIDLGRCGGSFSAKELGEMSRDPSGLIRMREIRYAPGRPGYVCLRLDPGPCLTRTELNLELPRAGEAVPDGDGH